MKKFLSLVLALIMTMSLVTVSAGAKDFTDDESLNYEEAVAVMSEIGVIDGYPDGSFKPQNGLTRGAAAKIICNMILGPTTASALRADTAPFKDVAVDNQYAGYIAYCVQQGITSGYTDGTYRPAAPLTNFAFMKMLLGALGYDAEIEGYVGGNCFIAVAKQAIGIGLNKGLKEDFDGGKQINREEAALFAFNTLQATMVDYDTKITATVNGAEVTIGNSVANHVAWNVANKNEGNIKKDGYVQFAEKYFTKLVKQPDTDAFGRPAYTWSWNNENLGTYVDYTTLVAEFTKKVEYKDLYEAVGKLAAEEYDMYDYLDGVDNTIDQAKITKKNDSKVPNTGNGVLTQVFVNNEESEFTVASVNTYLAQAVSDYSKTADQLTLRIYTGLNNANIIRTVDGDDFDIEGYEKDDAVLVTMAGTKLTVQSVETPEAVSEAAITTYSVDDTVADNGGQYKLGSVTADGTKYSTAVKAFWDAAYLWNYNKANEQLKDHKYNLYLDPYGYVLGLENVKDTTNYLFIVGYDSGSSVLAKTLDKALVIFPDGTMETVTCYEKDKNVKVVGGTGDSATVNEWWTYTVDEDGNYALKAKADDQFHDTLTTRGAGKDSYVLDYKEPTLTGTIYSSVQADNGQTGVAIGNDKSVYITVVSDKSVDTVNGSIVDVTNVTTGIKDTSIDMEPGVKDVSEGPTGAFVLMDGNYVKYAVVVGEDGSIGNRFVYLTTGIGERSWKAGPGYYWSYDAIVDGALLETDGHGENGFNTLVEVDDGTSGVDATWLKGNTLYKASYDKDGYAKNMALLTDNWDTADTLQNKDDGYVLITSNVGTVGETFPLTVKGNTIYLNTLTYSNRYVMTTSDTKFFVQNTDTVNGSDYVEYPDIDSAMAATGAVSGSTYYVTGKLAAVCDGITGFAKTIIISDSKFENKSTNTDTTTNAKYIIGMAGCGAGSQNVQVLIFSTDAQGNAVAPLTRAQLQALGLTEDSITIEQNGFTYSLKSGANETGSYYKKIGAAASQWTFSDSAIAYFTSYQYDGKAADAEGFTKMYGPTAGFMKIHIDAPLELGDLEVSIKTTNGNVFTAGTYEVQ